MYCGTSRTCPGSISVPRVIAKNSLRPRNWCRANRVDLVDADRSRAVSACSAGMRAAREMTDTARPRSVVVEDPVPGSDEVHGGEPGDDQQQHPRHRRRVAHLEIGEPLLVQ